ncbi:structural maintenance of chromosomes smc4 [Culex quinquefasciatus]|uniref:Structural maintenance of chromosomes smc4 n=1 Tax=Culex quinquefasciatus TaxID=7176 RepID=B0XET4_CULQU|nr:structural maintenance of chromosomes smc4 [Culex quinquefasciatus]|eukprot:XP_001868156.1 structural maintenance of chromosomes smc4 [Culex quinquefasciatus]
MCAPSRRTIKRHIAEHTSQIKEELYSWGLSWGRFLIGEAVLRGFLTTGRSISRRKKKTARNVLEHNRFLILQGEIETILITKPKALAETDCGLLEYL